jgi:hypothetical protein
MILRILALIAAAGGACGMDDARPSFDLRLELALERPPQRVREDFTNGGAATLPSTTLVTPIDADPPRVARIVAAADDLQARGGLVWGVGVEVVQDRFHIADGTPERSGPELHQRLLGGFAMLGWGFAPLPRLELEATAYGAIGLVRVHWVSPDISAGAAAGVGDGGYTEEGIRVAAGTALAPGMAQAFVGLTATQSGAEIDYDSGDSSQLRIIAAGWTAGIAVGYRF